MVDNDRDPLDLSILSSFYGGHGTHVAGTIGAVTNNNTGSVGVAPNVQIMNVRICGPYCMTTDIIRGINFARYNGAKVINMSLGAQYFLNSESDFDYITYTALENFSGVVAAAAGNNGALTDTNKFFPA